MHGDSTSDSYVRLCKMSGPDFYGRTWLETPEGETYLIKKVQQTGKRPMSFGRKMRLERSAHLLTILICIAMAVQVLWLR